MTVRASYVRRDAWLGKEFGEEFARRMFGDDIVDKLPRYTRGKNAGKFKAEIEWIKCERGGWKSDGPSYHGTPNGHVERRVGQIIAARIIGRNFVTREIEETFASKGDVHLLEH